MPILMTSHAQATAFQFLDPETKTPLVTARDEVVREGAVAVRKTTYTSPTAAVVGIETTRYDPATLALESYDFEDLTVGERTAIKVSGGKAEVSYVGEKGDDPRTSVIDWGDTAYSPKLLAELIAARWSELAKGKDVVFEMYVPFMLKTLGFRLRAGKPAADGTRVVRVEPTLFVLRPFVPAIDFTFAPGPELVSYAGPSSVSIGGEKHKAVEIRF